MRSFLRMAVIAVPAWISASGAVALAQTSETRDPYRGLFPPASLSGPSAPAKPAGAFAFSIRAFGALERDSSIAAAVGRPSGPYSALAAEVARTRVGPRVSTDLRGFSQVRPQASAGGVSIDTQWLAAGAQVRLTPRTSITVAQRIAYSPLYSPAASAASAGTTGAAANTNLTIATAAGLSRQISRRTTAALGYGYDRVRFSSTGESASTHRAAATLTHALGRALDVQMTSLSLWSAATGRTPAASAHDLVAGIVAAPKRTRTVELTMGITPGLSRRTEPRAAGRPALGAETRTSLVIGGFVRASRQVTRNWRAEAGYRRSTYYLPGGDRLISADAIGGAVNGRVGPHVEVAGSAGWSFGTPDQRQGQERVKSLATSGRVDWRPVSRSAVYLEVRRDAYSVSDGLTQLPGLSRTATTTSVRLGMTLEMAGARRAHRDR